MALTTCKECGAKISTDAKSCPSCGAKVPRTSALKMIVGGALILWAIAIVLGAFTKETPTPTVAQTQASTAEKEKAEADYQAAMAKAKGQRAQAFAANRAAIVANIQTLSRAGKWKSAYDAANEYWDVEDGEFQRLFKTADEKASASAAAQAKADAAKEAARKKAQARKEGVTIGMTKEQVLGSQWGRPEHINRTSTIRGDSEQWVYGGGNYLYFTGDILTSVQSSDRR